MKPRIGITVALDDTRSGMRRAMLNENYIRSVLAAGGLPLLVPVLGEQDAGVCLDALDGLIVSGGGDVLPLTYGEEPVRGLLHVSSERDESELHLVRLARERGMPLLGICRGHQVINVALGGTLYQDLPSQLPGCLDHSPPEGQAAGELRHTVTISDRRSRLASLFPEERIAVNSFHHQAVRVLAEGLKETARAQDGVTEGFEAVSGAFLMGVQFHPEALTVRYPAFLAIFRALVDAAAAA